MMFSILLWIGALLSVGIFIWWSCRGVDEVPEVVEEVLPDNVIEVTFPKNIEAAKRDQERWRGK